MLDLKILNFYKINYKILIIKYIFFFFLEINAFVKFLTYMYIILRDNIIILA